MGSWSLPARSQAAPSSYLHPGHCSPPLARGHATTTSELDCRASLWNQLCSQKDIDSITLELLGRHYADQSQPGETVAGCADRAFNLACQLEMIFGLQRTHLQSRTPYGLVQQEDSDITERLPYLLSLKIAKDAFACLRKEAMSYLGMCHNGQDDETSLRRMVVIRTLVSGTRMLCLHPDVESGDASLYPLSQMASLHFDPWERILWEICSFALRRVPEKHQGLQLQRMNLGRNMVCQLLLLFRLHPNPPLLWEAND